MAIGKPNCDVTTQPDGTRAILHRSDRLTIARWSILMVPWIGGCSPIEDNLIRNTAWLLTFFIPLFILALGGGYGIRWFYLKQLKNWDLERNPTAPISPVPIIVLIASGIVLWVFFALFNLSISMPSDQHWKNILGWLFGSVLGGVLAYWAGRRLATSQYYDSCRDAKFDAKRHL